MHKCFVFFCVIRHLFFQSCLRYNYSILTENKQLNTVKKGGPSMSLADDERAARAMGLSYGKWRALSYTPTESPTENPTEPEPEKRKRKTKKYTDQQLFDLWQQGKTDAEIGAAVGVSRAMIQRWRDNLEVPSTAKGDIDTKKYRLIETRYGPYVVTEEDLL